MLEIRATYIGEPVKEYIKGPAPRRVERGPEEAPLPQRRDRDREEPIEAPRRREKVPAGGLALDPVLGLVIDEFTPNAWPRD